MVTAARGSESPLRDTAAAASYVAVWKGALFACKKKAPASPS